MRLHSNRRYPCVATAPPPGGRSVWRILLAAAVAWAVADVAKALNPARSLYQYNCQTWRRANGLPVNAVNAIVQASDGRVWLGTPQGLIWFDGVAFHGTNAMADDARMITALAPAPTGGLWYGLEHGGFGHFNGEKFLPLHQPEWGDAMVKIRAMQTSARGELIAGGPNIAGKLVDPTTFQSLLPCRNADVFAVHEDKAGRIWIGTADNGLFYWQDNQLVPFPDQTLRGVVLSAVAVDDRGWIWVGTANGMRAYNAQFQEQPLAGFAAQPRAILVDRHGVVWVGSFSGGLIRYQDGAATSLRKQDGLASDRILSLAEAADGSLWVGTEDGLSELSDVKFPTLSTAEGLSHEASLAVVAAKDGGIWAGTPDGASHLEGERFRSYGHSGGDGFTSRWVKGVFAARNGDVYFIGGRKNLDRFSGGRVVKSWSNATSPRAVDEDSRGIIVAIGAELMRLENDALVPVTLADGTKVSLRWINDLLVARDDSIWIAAIEGVYRLKDGELRNLSHDNGLYYSTVQSLCEDDDGAVWASQTKGVARFKDGHARVITRQQGLHEDFVFAMVPDQIGGFWLDSSRGIFRVARSELNAVADGTAGRVHCTVYDGEDAVKTTDKAGDQYFGCRSADGRIWFPSSMGVVMIDPANMLRDTQPPTITIDRVLVNGREFRPGRSPALEPGAGNLEFDYVAVNYRAPQKVRYRYRLQGYETEWVEAHDRRSAFYTNLHHGRYRFEVQACNADGVWSETGATLALELPPRFHETIWFRLACAAGAIGMGVYFWLVLHLRRKHEQLRQTHELLEAKVRERTAELRAEIEERKKMQLEVERVQRELVEISRQAGMAEVATSVLHNVGNVLTSLNVSATVLNDRIRESKIAWVTSLRDLLRAHAGDLGAFFTRDPQGRQVPEFLDKLSSHLTAEQAALLAELESLRRNVEHIKEIVAMQQSYATVSGVTERVAVIELVEDALRMNAGSLARHEVGLVRDYQAQPVITVEKHKVLQVLVNVLRNAKYACDDSGRTDKQITIRITTEGESVKIAVIDNGVGIPAENLTRIFGHGFTTRNGGHGFGLHNGALAATKIGGSLRAFSAGPGKGATFVLELPFQPVPGAAQSW